MEENKPQADPHKRHALIWRLLRPVLRLVCWLKFGYVSRSVSLSGPFLLVSNHNTDWDPIFVNCAIREPMYFVASEQIFRSKVWGAFIRWAQDPIPRQKSASAAGTVLAMLRRLKAGYSVAVFPEGNRSWDGVTRPFPASIGKVARSGGVSLVTFRITGGYFASPRWAGSASRRGRVSGQVVRIYSPEELKAMTPREVYDHIRDDLAEDAYARQRKNPICYRGRRLAEHLETLLYRCPRCGRLHTLDSRDDTLHCRGCGGTFRYLPTGYLTGDGLPSDELKELVRLQKEALPELCAQAGDTPIFLDTDMTAQQLLQPTGEKALGKGELRLYRDRLELPGKTVPLSELAGLSVMGAQTLFVTAGDEVFAVRSQRPRCVVKYIDACALLTGKELGI